MTGESVYDCIVLGFGGVGSQALRHAAMRGWRTLGLDQFGPAHDRGSSHGQSRVIRKAYFEHPNYVPLLLRAYEMWDELNKRHRTKPEVKELLTTTGLVQIGDPDGATVQGVLESARQNDLSVERFSATEVMQRLPIFQVPDHYLGVFEPDAGFLRVELCVAAAIKQAIVNGAEIKSGVAVERWSTDAAGAILVETDKGQFRSKRLIVAAGAWASQLLPDVPLELSVVQKQQHWYQLDRVDQKLANGFPAFLVEHDGECFYGLPEFDHLGMKVCKHTGGKPLQSPNQLSHELNKAELTAVESFMQSFFEFGRSRLVHHSNCMYTNSVDGHFIVDQLPGNHNVSFAAGLSGHGFKFAPVIGKYLVDLLDGQTDELFDFLKMR